MAVAITDIPPPQHLRADISKYDLARTVETVEALYFEALGRVVGKLDRTSE
jgi:hypothetical protein